jgi:hypothetical protein
MIGALAAIGSGVNSGVKTGILSEEGSSSYSPIMSQWHGDSALTHYIPPGQPLGIDSFTTSVRFTYVPQAVPQTLMGSGWDSQSSTCFHIRVSAGSGRIQLWMLGATSQIIMSSNSDLALVAGTTYIFQLSYRDNGAQGFTSRFINVNTGEETPETFSGGTLIYDGGILDRGKWSVGGNFQDLWHAQCAMGDVWMTRNYYDVSSLPITGEMPGSSALFNFSGTPTDLNYGVVTSGTITDWTMFGRGVDPLPAIQELAWRTSTTLDRVDPADWDVLDGGAADLTYIGARDTSPTGYNTPGLYEQSLSIGNTTIGSTTLTSTVSAGVTQVPVASEANFNIGDSMVIDMLGNLMHWAKVTGTGSGTIDFLPALTLGANNAQAVRCLLEGWESNSSLGWRKEAYLIDQARHYNKPIRFNFYNNSLNYHISYDIEIRIGHEATRADYHSFTIRGDQMGAGCTEFIVNPALIDLGINLRGDEGYQTTTRSALLKTGAGWTRASGIEWVEIRFAGMHGGLWAPGDAVGVPHFELVGITEGWGHTPVMIMSQDDGTHAIYSSYGESAENGNATVDSYVQTNSIPMTVNLIGDAVLAGTGNIINPTNATRMDDYMNWAIHWSPGLTSDLGAQIRTTAKPDPHFTQGEIPFDTTNGESGILWGVYRNAFGIYWAMVSDIVGYVQAGDTVFANTDAPNEDHVGQFDVQIDQQWVDYKGFRAVFEGERYNIETELGLDMKGNENICVYAKGQFWNSATYNVGIRTGLRSAGIEVARVTGQHPWGVSQIPDDANPSFNQENPPLPTWGIEQYSVKGCTIEDTEVFKDGTTMDSFNNNFIPYGFMHAGAAWYGYMHNSVKDDVDRSGGYMPTKHFIDAVEAMDVEIQLGKAKWMHPAQYMAASKERMAYVDNDFYNS